MWRLLLVVVGIAGLLGTGYAWIVSSPTGSSPDDDYHQTSIWCPTPIEKHCPIVGTDDSGHPIVEVPETVDASSVTYAFMKDVSAAALFDLSDRVMRGTNRVDDGDYPGHYYDFMYIFVGNDVDRAILVMRWVNFGMSVVLFGASLLLSSPPNRRLLAYTLLCAALPITIYFTASVNPSSWAYTGIVSLWIGLQGFFTAHGWRRAGMAGIALAGGLMAAAARTDAAMYCAIVALATVVFHLRRVLLHKALLIIPVAAALVGAFSFALTRQSSSLMAAPDTSDPDAPAVNPIHMFLSNVRHLPDVLLSFWGTDLGWFDVPNPTVTRVLLLLVTIVVAGYGFIRSRCDWHKIAALVIIGAAFYGLPVLMLQMQHMYLGQWGLQVRYVAPLMIVFIGMLMAGSPRTDPRPLPWYISSATVLALAVAHSFLLHALIRRYVTGVDVPGFNLNPGAEWWRAAGPSPMATWLMGTVGFFLFCSAFIASGRKDRLDSAIFTG